MVLDDLCIYNARKNISFILVSSKHKIVSTEAQ